MAPKKKTPRSIEPADRNWGVVLEEIRAQMGAVIEGMQDGFRRLETRMDETESRSARRFDDLEAVVRQNGADIRKNGEDIRKNSEDIRKNGEDIQSLTTRVDRLDARVEKLGHIEARVAALENRSR